MLLAALCPSKWKVMACVWQALLTAVPFDLTCVTACILKQQELHTNQSRWFQPPGCYRSKVHCPARSVSRTPLCHIKIQTSFLTGIPEGATNQQMRAMFSEAINYFQGPPFDFAFLQTDVSRPGLDKDHPPQQALLHYAISNGEYYG